MASLDLLPENSLDLKPKEDQSCFELAWSLLDGRRDLLYDLFEAVRAWEFDKIDESKKKKPKEVQPERLEELVDTVKVVEPLLEKFTNEELLETLLRIESNPPPPLTCHFEDFLLQKSSDGSTLKNHDKISLILSYLDTDSLLSLSLSSRKVFYAFKVHMNKELYNLPFNGESICTNLICWKQIIDFFFKFAGTLRPIDRNQYLPLSKLIQTVKSVFPVSPESKRSHTYVTFDSIPSHYIVYCDHEKPMSHTCCSSNALNWDNKATTKLITLSEFISEYYQRFQVNDDQFFCGFNSDSVSPKYICLLLKSYLEAIAHCISNHDGQIEFRKTEFISNAKHSIVHRIWIQLSLKWDYRFGSDPQNSLYLTIADHFRLDS